MMPAPTTKIAGEFDVCVQTKMFTGIDDVCENLSCERPLQPTFICSSCIVHSGEIHFCVGFNVFIQSVQVNVLIFILMFSKQYLMIITALGVL
jgi:hypothetical protein